LNENLLSLLFQGNYLNLRLQNKLNVWLMNLSVWSMLECKIYVCRSSYHVRGNDFVFQAGKGQEEQQMHFSAPKGS